jgi:ParB family chromosome partitioning protein
LQERLALDVIHGGLSVRAVEDLVRAALQAEAAAQAALESSLESSNGASAAHGGEMDRPADGLLPGPAPARPASPQPTGALPSRLRPPGLLDLEELLGDYLNTRVSVDMGAKHGRVVIEFANLDDLERIYRVIIGGNGTGE